jgi:hypothetical protein
VRTVHALLAATRMLKLYPPGHNRVAAHFDELHGDVEDLFKELGDEVTISVTRKRLEINKQQLKGAPELAAGLAVKLRRRGVRMLRIRRGVRRDEVQHLARVLATDHRDLIKQGGIAGALPDNVTHIDLRFVRGPEARKLELRDDLPAHVVDALEGCLHDIDTVDRLERLRANLTAVGNAAHETFELAFSEFFARPELAERDGASIAHIFEEFLHRLEQTLLGAAPRDDFEARLNSIRSLFQSLPAELLGAEVAEVEEEEKDLAGFEEIVAADDGGDVGTGAESPEYEIEGISELADLVRDNSAVRAIRNRLASHDAHENALLILCELMVNGETRREFEDRRRIFLEALGSGRFSAAAIARILRYIAVDMPATPFSNRDSLISDVFESTENQEALMLFLGSMTNHPEATRPIIDRLAMRPDPFDLLVKMMREPLLAAFHPIMASKILDAARHRPEALSRWARENRDAFFSPEVFEPLFARCTEFLGGICKEILSGRATEDRTALIGRLTERGTDSSLRMLILGLPYGDNECDEELLNALAAFQHPLALAALREVIYRNNGNECNREEVGRAIRAVRQMGTKDSDEFLWEIIQAKSALLPMYRREVRKEALAVLEGNS